MGIYYRAIDFQTKEYIDPPGDFSTKFPGICHPNNPFSMMVIMENARGADFEIVNDMNHLYYADGIKDVTEQTYADLKKLWPEYDWEKAEWKEEMGKD